MNSKLKIAIAAFGIALTCVTTAQAGGVLADFFVRPFAPKLADKIDEEHARMGNPLDKLAEKIAREAVHRSMNI